MGRRVDRGFGQNYFLNKVNEHGDAAYGREFLYQRGRDR